MTKWNGKRFSIYTSDEENVLNLIEELGVQTNHNTERVETIIENDKERVTHKDINETYKIDKTGNFTGTWHGLNKPTMSDEGMRATVEDIIDNKIPTIQSSLDNIVPKIDFLNQLRCKFIYGIHGNGEDETEKIQRFILETPNGGVAYFPRGKYKIKSLYIPNKGNITIEGETDIPDYNGGKNGTIFTFTDYNKDKLHLDGSYGVSIKNIEFRPYEDYVKTDVIKYGDCIHLNGSGQSRIENCIIHGFNKAIKITNCGINVIKGNKIFNSSIGIYGKECGDSEYLNNYIYDISFDQDENWLKADVERGCAMCLAWCGNSTIRGGKIEWNAKGILLRDAHGVAITNIAFDYNRGFDISLDRTMNDYTWDKNRPQEHIQTDGKYNTYDIKISNNTFLSSGHFGSFEDNYYGSNISLYETNNIVINGNTFSYGSWQAYANEMGVTPLKESGLEPIRQKSGAKVAFIRLRKAPRTVVTSNTFNSHYSTIPVTINDITIPVSSCLFNNNISSNSPTSDLTKSAFFTVDTECRKVYSVGDNLPTNTRGTYGYMDEIDFFNGSTRQKLYCTKSGTIRPLAEVWGSCGSENLKVLYCSREITEQDFLIDDFITVEGHTRKIVGFFKPKDGGNHFIKVNEEFPYPVNGKIEFAHPSFT